MNNEERIGRNVQGSGCGQIEGNIPKFLSLTLFILVHHTSKSL
jgi:hypothetical protein